MPSCVRWAWSKADYHRTSRKGPGGSVKAEGLGDGFVVCAEDHRQASLDDATQGIEVVTSNAHTSTGEGVELMPTINVATADLNRRRFLAVLATGSGVAVLDHLAAAADRPA